jgi:hypothetical protein
MAAALKLYLRPLDPPQTIWLRRPDGTRGSLAALRLVSFANLMRHVRPARDAGSYALPTAVIDTGAHYSVIAERLWRHFRPGFVTPLPFDAQTPPALRTLTIAGGTYPYTLGELTFDLQDLDLCTLNVTIIAKLVQDAGRLAIPLTLGLRGGFLDGRKLHAKPDPSASFGQAWGIEDA